MRYILISILFFINHLTYSQIIWEDNKDFQNISNQIYFLEDKNGTMDSSQICSGKYDSSFSLSDKPMLNFGFNKSTYWLRFSFESKKSDSLLLALEHAFIPNAELYYQLENGMWQSMKSGYKVQVKDKIIKDHFQVFPISSEGKKYYIKLVPYLHPIIVKVWKPNAFQLNSQRLRLVYGLYAGILFFAIIINFFLFFALKKIYYLLYSILVFLYIAASAGVMEGYMIYFFPEIDLMYWYMIIPVLNMPSLLLYCLSFLEIKKASSKLYKITGATCLFLFLYIICLHFLPFVLVLILNQVFAFLVFILTISIGIIVGKRGNKMGYYFSVTYSIWFILLCIEYVYIQFGVPSHIFELSYVSVAIFCEALLLAFLLAKRFQWERNADEKVKTEMQRDILEIKQRFQNEIMKAQLEMQEQTLQNISQEIHDNIGQTLSLIKINLNMVDSKIPQEQKERLLDSKELLSKVIHELRDLTKTMDTDYIKDIGLTTAIEQQVNLIKKTGRYTIDFSVKGRIETYELQKELLIFRIVQELINNTLKHANASTIIIKMNYYNEKLSIMFDDNGIGFNMEEVNIQKLKGLGLRNIINRTELIGGSIKIKSKPMNGTNIILTVPN